MHGPELYQIAREFLDEEFDMELDIPIFINNRLKKVLGRFRRKNGKSFEIEMSGDFISYAPREEIIDVLKHELVHYALFELGKPFHDGDKYFEDTLKRLGVKPTKTYAIRGKVHEYECINCHARIRRKRRLAQGTRCVCTNVQNLKYNGVVEI